MNDIIWIIEARQDASEEWFPLYGERGYASTDESLVRDKAQEVRTQFLPEALRVQAWVRRASVGNVRDKEGGS